MNLPLSGEEREALADFLNEAIADRLYPLSLKLRPIRSVLAKLERPEAEADAVAIHGDPSGGSLAAPSGSSQGED
jgi:hypothetical protein